MTDPLTSQPAGRLIPELPDEISISIFARVPRSSHLSLSHVSRSWRSLFRSTLLFSVRSSATLSTKPTLCLAIRTPSSQFTWLILHRGRRNPSHLPPPPLSAVGSACAAVGPFIFVLGGSISAVPSSGVQILDLRFRRWSAGPSMSAAREFAASATLNGHVYALGGCLPPLDSWAESLHPFDENPLWISIPSPAHIQASWMHGCAVLLGRILAMADRGGVSYDPNPASDLPWDSVPKWLDLEWKGRAAVVDEILYIYDYMGKIKGYDINTGKWVPVEGVDQYLPNFLLGVAFVNLGGLLCLVWERRGNGGKRKEMEVDWVAIEITRTGEGGLRGSIMWWDTAELGLPYRSTIAHCVVAEL